MIAKRFFILLVYMVSVLLFINCTSETKPTDQPDNTNPVLLISIDGLMPEYIERNVTPNFDRIAQDGVKAESMTVVFPTKTFPTHYSIVTGLYPENHGIIANSFYDYELDARFSFGPPEDDHQDGDWWGGEPIWVTVENQSKTAATVFWPGSDSEIRGVRPTRYLDYDESVPNGARIDTVISWLHPEGEVKADFSTLYYSDVDYYGHRFGPHSEEVDRRVREADEWIGYLLEQMEANGLSDMLNLIIVSDHGMAKLSEDRIIFLDDLIDLGYVDLIDWTPVAMIRPDQGKTGEVYRRLKENEENYRVYLKEDLPDRYHFKNHYRIPDIIMIADLGYTITTHQFLDERGLITATHGFDNQLPEMHAFFLAKGPDFQQGLEVNVIESIHLYELMVNILKLQPAANDGSINKIRHVLR